MRKLSNISIMSAILFVISMFIILVINYFAQKFKFGGELTLTDKTISVKTTNKSAEFALNEISNLDVKFERSDFEAGNFKLSILKFYMWLFGKAGGLGNYLSFIHNKEKYKFEIYIKSMEKTDILRKWAIEHKAMHNE